MPKKRVAGARIQAHSSVGRCINRALINMWGRMEGQIEGEWVEVALNFFFFLFSFIFSHPLPP